MAFRGRIFNQINQQLSNNQGNAGNRFNTNGSNTNGTNRRNYNTRQFDSASRQNTQHNQNRFDRPRHNTYYPDNTQNNTQNTIIQPNTTMNTLQTASVPAQNQLVASNVALVADPNADTSIKPCNHFILGACRFRDGCKFRHTYTQDELNFFQQNNTLQGYKQNRSTPSNISNLSIVPVTNTNNNMNNMNMNNMNNMNNNVPNNIVNVMTIKKYLNFEGEKQIHDSAINCVCYCPDMNCFLTTSLDRSIQMHTTSFDYQSHFIIDGEVIYYDYYSKLFVAVVYDKYRNDFYIYSLILENGSTSCMRNLSYHPKGINIIPYNGQPAFIISDEIGNVVLYIYNSTSQLFEEKEKLAAFQTDIMCQSLCNDLLFLGCADGTLIRKQLEGMVEKLKIASGIPIVDNIILNRTTTSDIIVVLNDGKTQCYNLDTKELNGSNSINGEILCHALISRGEKIFILISSKTQEGNSSLLLFDTPSLELLQEVPLTYDVTCLCSYTVDGKISVYAGTDSGFIQEYSFPG
ncbi:hypothetical protein WA158_006129 [Blastocystis sp. Blastoise]